ncbi:MAG TPA: hypothetical protein VFP94_02170 [Terriglobales bacterium]|nr:hypothetical protein [Terriglobales bacterium]
MPSARKSKSGHAGRWWLLILVIALGVWGWFYFLHRPAWNHMVGDLLAPRRSAANPCGAPLPSLSGGAIAASRTGKLVTIEELRREAATPGIYKVQARLLGLSQDGIQVRLHLASLVNPSLTLDAWIPGQGCGAGEDAALYDELREIASLRFGPLQPTPVAPKEPTQVLVTGALSQAGGSLALRPVLDLHVQ